MIWFAGDPHGSLAYLLPLVQAEKPDALVILGDLALQSSADLQALEEVTEVWFIPGNHDSLSVAAYEALFSGAFGGRNLHGRVVEIAGVRIAGLGGVFRGQIWMPPYKPMFFDPIHYCQHLEQGQLWRGGLPLRHRTTLFPSDLEGLSQQQADILVTHEAPAAHPRGFQVIDNVARSLGVRQLFHGHHHINREYDPAVGFQAVAVGYRAVCDQHLRWISLGEEVAPHHQPRQSRHSAGGDASTSRR
ncbi:MAG: metallophosphoesterase family protein [Plesiomonas sp.]|uniref:metallophosphoesterase family protein n=1 Tax=Plesiomonas sp. TaxID=2486279 RepID=UPI003EE46885